MPLLERLIDRLGFSMAEIDELDATPDDFKQEAQAIEDDDISIADAVEVLHREARKIEAIG